MLQVESPPTLCYYMYIINIRAFAPEVDRLIRENVMAFLFRCLMMLAVLIIYDKKKKNTFPIRYTRMCIEYIRYFIVFALQPQRE